MRRVQFARDTNDKLLESTLPNAHRQNANNFFFKYSHKRITQVHLTVFLTLLL